MPLIWFILFFSGLFFILGYKKVLKMYYYVIINKLGNVIIADILIERD